MRLHQGYQLNSGNCEECVTFCHTCDEDGCVSSNITLFASLAAGVLVAQKASSLSPPKAAP
jgi:hypothetical protein